MYLVFYENLFYVKEGVEIMQRRLRMKCAACGHWNRILVDKLFMEPDSPEPNVKVLIPMYKPLHVSTCKNCGNVIADPQELIRITGKQAQG